MSHRVSVRLYQGIQAVLDNLLNQITLQETDS